MIDPPLDVTAFLAIDRGEVGTAYLYRSISTMARVAAVLGHDEESTRYSQIAAEVKSAWQTEFLREGGRTVDDSQAAYVRALNFDLLPDADRPLAATRLVHLLEAAEYHPGTGFLATGLLLPTLADAGHPDVAYRVLLQRTAPSWLYMLDQGATTMWEDWYGVMPDGTARDSLNHYSKGAVVQFLHHHIAGVRQSASSVGGAEFDIAPVPSAEVSRIDYTLRTPRGVLELHWRQEEDFYLDVRIPSATIAHVTLPDGTAHRLEAGTHHLVGRPPRG